MMKLKLSVRESRTSLTRLSILLAAGTARLGLADPVALMRYRSGAREGVARVAPFPADDACRPRRYQGFTPAPWRAGRRHATTTYAGLTGTVNSWGTW